MPFPPLTPPLQQALAERDYNEPTPVQLAVLEDAAHGRDLVVSAQTGSGKTVAYGLAIAPTLLGDAERFGRAAEPLALVVAPTRELAMQVHGELSWLYARTGARVVSCVGGMDSRREQQALAAGCHIVVGTPGRLRDHIERRHLNLSHLRAVVLDEADEMLDLGFREDLEFILDATPPERRTLLFSATIAREIAALARQYQRDALRIDTTGRNQPHSDIEYRAVTVAGHELERAVVNVLRWFEVRAALVFCNTREGVRRLHGSLVERGFTSVALSGELSQHERTGALQALRDGRARVCVATDVAARGLDLPDLDLVVHADLPTNRETLLHRSGRTGRAGRKGTSVLLVANSKRRRAESLIASAGVAAGWSAAPTADEIRGRDQERLLADPLLTEAPAEDELALAQTLLAQSTPEAVAAALVRLYRSRLPAPEELSEQTPAATARAPRDYERSDAQATSRPHVPRRKAAAGDMAWFRANVGRRANADPKWLLPLICRLGGVTRQEVGTIRIFDRESRFEISRDAAERFAEAVQDAHEGTIRIEPAGDAPPPEVDAAAPTRPPKPAGSSRRAPQRQRA